MLNRHRTADAKRPTSSVPVVEAVSNEALTITPLDGSGAKCMDVCILHLSFPGLSPQPHKTKADRYQTE
jgi:hypothetical protein